MLPILGIVLFAIYFQFVDAKGKSKKHKCVVFPWYDVNNSTVRGVKLVKLDADVSDSSFTIEPRYYT